MKSSPSRTAVLSSFLVAVLVSGCGKVSESDRTQALSNAKFELVNWELEPASLGVLPVVWVRVLNYNPVMLRCCELEYRAFDLQGNMLSTGTLKLSADVAPGCARNFVGLRLGPIDRRSQRIEVKLRAVTPA